MKKLLIFALPILLLNINCSQNQEKNQTKINFEKIIWNPGPGSDNSDSNNQYIYNLCSFTKEDTSLVIVQINQYHHQYRGLCSDSEHYATASGVYEATVLQLIGGPELPSNITILDVGYWTMSRFEYQEGDFALIKIKEYNEEYFAQGSIKIEETYTESQDNDYIVNLPTTLDGLIFGYNETLNNKDECPEEYEYTTEEWEKFIYGDPANCPNLEENNSNLEENNSNPEGGCNDDPEDENACP